jgi:hypothetical protein
MAKNKASRAPRNVCGLSPYRKRYNMEVHKKVEKGKGKRVPRNVM